VVADHGEVVAAAIVTVAGDDDIAVAVNGHAVGIADGACVEYSSQGGDELAIGVEGGVKTVIVVRASHGAGPAAGAVAGVAGNDDPAVAVDEHAPGNIIQGAEGGGHYAVGVKGCVERTVLVIASESEVEIAGAGGARNHDLTIAINGHAVGVVVRGTDGRGHL